MVARTTGTTKSTTSKASTTKSTTARKRIVKPVPPVNVEPPARVATIPDASYDETYINRKFGPGLDDYILFDHARLTHENVLIEGPTATGKTSAVLGWAASRELPFYSVSSNIGVEPSQLFGKYIVDETTGLFTWQDGPVTDLVRHGGVLLINEINFIPERVSTVLFSLLDKRRQIQLAEHRGETVSAHVHDETCADGENCKRELSIFADMNPDYAGTRPMNAAFRNRFCAEARLGLTTHGDWRPARQGPQNLCIKLAVQVRKQLETGEFTTPVGTNMLMEFVQHYTYLGLDYASGCFVNAFPYDERSAIKQVVATHSSGIENDLRKIERLTPFGEPTYNKEYGGMYGIDWTYDEDEDLSGAEEEAPDGEYIEDEEGN